MAETISHPAETFLGNSLDGASPYDYSTNDASGGIPNGFVDSMMFSDQEASEDSRANFSDNHSNDAKTTVADHSDYTNNNNYENEQQRNITLRSADSSEDVERKFKERRGTDEEL